MDELKLVHEKDKKMTTKLSLASLGKLGSKVATPKYTQASLKPGILHFGVGNFHRAHMAVYLDDLFNLGVDHDWALVGAGVMPSDEATRQKLASQDYLTTVVEQDNELSTAHITSPLVDFIAPADKAGMIAKLCAREIRIVSLTITEGGYFIDASTGKFNPDHPAIVKDVAHPDDPSTVFGFIVAGLAKRRAAGIPPFTVMSCDNVPHNGVVTRNSVVGLARLVDPALAEWITANVAFPNGMVDRITPATGDRERKICAEMFGVEDVWPVFCEEFKQWVLEDNFTCGRPSLEKVGVTFVKDVTPYENMKIRMLNGGHAVIAYVSGLLDIHFVHECMENPLVTAFLAKIEKEEIMPCVPPVPDTNLNDYLELVERRFANPKIGDTVRRLCLDGSNRQPKFIVPSVADRLKAGKGMAGLALASALWCRYCYGTTESGAVIEANDPNWDHLQAIARKAKDNPAAWLAMADIYGDTAKSPVFVEAFSNALRSVWAKGTEATVKAYLSS
jgi:mannitol 2-dehydrogenase